MFNTLMQADNYYHINSDDLVIICWTNVCREDRYIENRWHTPGNIFTQKLYDKDFVNKFANPFGCLVRDLAFIKASDLFLQSTNCDYHFLSMMDLNLINQWDPEESISCDGIRDQYHTTTSKIHKSFYEVLWNNDLSKKISSEKEYFTSNFRDGHPLPKEHVQYLEFIFDYKFSQKTIDSINNAEEKLKQYILINDLRNMYSANTNYDDHLVINCIERHNLFI